MRQMKSLHKRGLGERLRLRPRLTKISKEKPLGEVVDFDCIASPWSRNFRKTNNISNFYPVSGHLES